MSSSSIEKAIKTAKKFSGGRNMVRSVKSPIDEAGKPNSKKSKRSAKRSKNSSRPRRKISPRVKNSARKRNELQHRVDLLLIRNVKKEEEKVLDVSHYIPGDYSTIKVINKPKSDKKKQLLEYPIFSSDPEKLKIVSDELEK